MDFVDLPFQGHWDHHDVPVVEGIGLPSKDLVEDSHMVDIHRPCAEVDIQDREDIQGRAGIPPCVVAFRMALPRIHEVGVDILEAD